MEEAASSPAAEADEAEAVDEQGPADQAEEMQAAVLDVAFGSVAAARLADELNLTTADFKDWAASGVKGFTVFDVRNVAVTKTGEGGE